jgi:hypothetical protein
MKTTEDKVHDAMCDYVTKRIRSIRVDIEGDVRDVTLSKEMKDVLDKALAIIPSNVIIERKT